MYFYGYVGNDLTFCSTPDLQCCSNNGLMERRTELRGNLSDALRDLLRYNDDILDNVDRNLTDCKLHHHCMFMPVPVCILSYCTITESCRLFAIAIFKKRHKL